MGMTRDIDTTLIHSGRDPERQHGLVNPPVTHGSTVLFPSLDALETSDHAPFEGVNYGRIGTPIVQAFETAVAELEGGYRAVAFESGVAAITTALTAFTKAGDHILVADSVYGPTRRYCSQTLSRYGVTTEFYDPRIGGGIASLIRPETTLVFTESPGSLTFEVQDVPAIAAAARARGVKVLMDNTWATPLNFRALDHGVDVSIHSGTKYLVGHADAMSGVAVCAEDAWLPLKRAAVALGHCPGPDDAFLALRGLRTLSVRLARHQESALILAERLAGRPEVTRVIHPARPDHPDHALWKRDFKGSSGLFAFALRPAPRAAVAAMVDGMRLFGLGYSWGGYESLLLPVHPRGSRTAVPWTDPGPLMRVHAGLENVDDLMADLEDGFRRFNAAL